MTQFVITSPPIRSSKPRNDSGNIRRHCVHVHRRANNEFNPKSHQCWSAVEFRTNITVINNLQTSRQHIDCAKHLKSAYRRLCPVASRV